MANTLSNLSYTNKDFQTIFPELLDYVKSITLKWDPSTSNESDPGVVLLKVAASLADKLNYNIDKNILECFPSTVTQTRNAWALFEQLGYYMHWYKSSETDISIKWIGEYDDSQITIPRFSLVCDDEQQALFTTTTPITFNASADNNIATAHVIEGSPVKVSISGKTVLTIDNLDNENKIFLSDSNVAENGIFINNYGYSNFSEWEKVDNLYIQSYAKKYYKFGVDIVNNLPYIQFPDTVADMIGEGIEITYIQSSGENGNVKAYLLSQFYESDINGIDVSSVNINLTNPKSSTGGADIESIEDAYKGFKRIANVCDTLTTTEDYQNYLLNSNLVSNCIVTDRRNDISMWDIKCIDSNNVEYTEYINMFDIFKSGTADNPELFGHLYPYTLRIIPLKYQIDADIMSNKSVFDSTFDFDYNTTSISVDDSTDYIKIEPIIPYAIQSYLNNSKSICHTYTCISDGIVDETAYTLFYNLYNLNITIYPTYKLSDYEIADVKSNILSALYDKLNAKKIMFGEEVTYEQVIKIVEECDSRIKLASIEPLDYRLIACGLIGTTSITNTKTQLLPVY